MTTLKTASIPETEHTKQGKQQQRILTILA